jgi:hypothetical protein
VRARGNRLPEYLHLTPADARHVPWKNGRGFTAELALWPAGAVFERGDFDWRISQASVEADGPFSPFPGFERVLVVTSGQGLVLAHGGEAPWVRLRALEPARFLGDWPTSAQLVAGPVADFNVLVRRGRWRADVEPLKLGRRHAREPLGAGHAFVHALSGSVVVRATGAEEASTLHAGESYWVQELKGGEELDLAGRDDACALLLVRIEPDARCA